MASHAPQFGWIGLGNMGNPMAQNLQKYRSEKGEASVRFWNRTMSKGDELKSLGGLPCESIASVVESSDVVFISTGNDAHLTLLVGEIVAVGDLSGKIIIDTTTVHPDTTKPLAEQVARANGSFLAAPVFGIPAMVVKRTCMITIAGKASAIDTVAPYIKGVLSHDIIRVAEEPEKASLLKIIGNTVISGMTELLGEAHVFAEKSGVGSDVLEELLVKQYDHLISMISRRLTQGVYMPPPDVQPFSNIDLALKDVGHGIDCAKAAGTELKVAGVALGNIKRAKQWSLDNNRELDSSAMYGIVREDAGLDFANDFIKERDGTS